jgi:hypothetical protein
LLAGGVSGTNGGAGVGPSSGSPCLPGASSPSSSAKPGGGGGWGTTPPTHHHLHALGAGGRGGGRRLRTAVRAALALLAGAALLHGASCGFLFCRAPGGGRDVLADLRAIASLRGE